MLDDEVIRYLEKMGFRRWTKHGFDRLYVSPHIFGVRVESMEDGTVSTTLDGRDIGRDAARKIMDGKYFIDVMTGKIGVEIESDFLAEIIRERIRNLVWKSEERVDQMEAKKIDPSFEFDWNEFFKGMDRIFPKRVRTKENLTCIWEQAARYHVDTEEMKKYVQRSINPHTGVFDREKLKALVRYNSKRRTS